MRCYICDSPIDKPTFDDDHRAHPCDKCDSVIKDTYSDDDLDDLDFIDDLDLYED